MDVDRRERARQLTLLLGRRISRMVNALEIRLEAFMASRVEGIVAREVSEVLFP